MPTSAEPSAATRDLASQAPRYLPLETVSIRLPGASAASGEPVFGVLANISETGCCVITNVLVSEGAADVLELETPRWPEPVEIPSVVIWSAERVEPVKEIVGFLTGLRFEKPPSAERAALLASGIFQLVP